MSLSLSTILGVVPDETSEWNPEIAPHMMQMKTKGKIGPSKYGPPPCEDVVDHRRLELRVGHDHADDQQRDRADLEEARQVVARAEQQPDRQHRRDEAVGGDGADGLIAR